MPLTAPINATLQPPPTQLLVTYKVANGEHYAILGFFGQFALEIKPMREIAAIMPTIPMINQK